MYVCILSHKHAAAFTKISGEREREAATNLPEQSQTRIKQKLDPKWNCGVRRGLEIVEDSQSCTTAFWVYACCCCCRMPTPPEVRYRKTFSQSNAATKASSQTYRNEQLLYPVKKYSFT
ncbi:hypothetical protein CIPAW_13G173900 [Carya illinoinensis]|uniref:Uncharacterized protein n=1 Tax=Carya illinoinensis TaxID=32201 RepID=A0A8T1NT99_CARIL|nr:hypothetical protein CIPAW_13G173900 [Carya illinoinensis]